MTPKTALIFLALIALLPHKTFSWDLAVTVGEHIEFFHNNGSGVGAASKPFNELSAITYDSVYETLYFCDNKHEDITIFSYKLDPSKDFQPLLERKFSENVQGIAFDPMIETLFWTDGKTKSINRMSLMPGSNPDHISNVLMKFTNGEEPKAITVDSCRGYIYWTNVQLNNPTIERMTVDGKNRTVIIKDDLFTPLGITIDQATQKLCWTDDKEGVFYKIECSNLDGSNRVTVYHGMNHQPYSLVVNNGTVYWTDWSYKSIWKMPLEPNNQSAPVSLKNFTHGFPNGIVAKIDLLEQITGVPECKGLEKLILNVTNKHEMPQNDGVPSKIPTYCLNGGKFMWKLDNKLNPKLCQCSRGYTGERCEISLCYNYCLNGTCMLDNEGFPKCRCDNGFYGERCTKSICKGYCLNNGSCEVNDNKQATCTCLSGWKGSRCEEKNQTAPDCKYQEITMEENMTNNVKHTDSSPEEENKNMNKSYTLLNSPEPTELNIFEETSNCFGWNAGLPIVTFLSCLCLILSIIIVILGKKVIVLKRRPRIRKRIIVNKNVTPLTCRPNPQQCEITIENCCNMNVCETPCFEPNSLRAQIADMSVKDEKKQLLLNQELHDGTY